MSRRSVYRAVVAAALLAGIAYLALNRELLTPARVANELRRFGRFAPVLFMLLYAIGTVLFVPGSLLTLAGGAMFGPIWGTLVNLGGATVGAALAFLIARYLARDWVARKSGDRLARLMRGTEEEGWRFVALVRLVPLFPFNLVNYAFGLTPIAFIDYVIASLVCMAPGAFAYTYLGYAGRQAASGQRGAIRTALIALALLAAIALLPRVVRRLRKADDSDAATPERTRPESETLVRR